MPPDRRGTGRLATQLIVAFVVVIVLTAIAAGIPAYRAIRSELERQAWSRVEDARHATGALLNSEHTRMQNLVMLAAQRPTLLALLREEQHSSLPAYLERIRSSAGLDILAVRDADGQTLAGSDLAAIQPAPAAGVESRYAVVDGSPPVVALIATQPVTDSDSGALLGYVTGGILLDDGFTARLEAETGVEQSVLVDGKRVASSIEGAAGTARTLEAQTGEVFIGESRYYTACVPLAGGRCSAVAQVEAALPIAGMIAAQQRALSVLALSTALVAVLGSAIGALLARRLTAPLAQLTRAASAISQGDLETPVPIPAEPLEIRTLATALEESRASTRRSLEGLAQARDWSENLIRSINEGVVTFDTAGNITFFSEGAERITGWPREEALGRPIDEVFKTAEEDGEPFTARIPPRGGKHQIGVLARDGRPVTLAVSGARLVPPQGETVQVVLVLRDVTEEEAGRHLRSYFLANITHEFRTPLAALSASIELLMDEAARLAQPGISELLGSLHLSVLNLQTLIDNLLESSSIEAGRFTVRRRPTDLNRVVANAIRTVQPLLDGRGQPLSLAEPTRLPTVQADPTRLVQVLVNLLSNASKYSPPGAPVDLSVEVSENRVRVAVADRGPGIPPGERASLFRRFVRLDTPGQEQYGIGLGLSVARAIVEGHGGEIGVDERAGGGSVFWFTLPLEGTP